MLTRRILFIISFLVICNSASAVGSISGISPNEAYACQNLTITISGTGTQFTNTASCPLISTDVQIKFNAAPITFSTGITIINDSVMEADFTIPDFIGGPGFDIYIDYDTCADLICDNCFFINGIVDAPSAINGETTPCKSSTKRYNINSIVDATSYVWTLPMGWSGISVDTFIFAQIPLGATIDTIFVRGVSVNTCVDSSVASFLVVNPIATPATPGAIGIPIEHCVGSVELYTVGAVADATSYNWFLPAGWAGSSSTNSISVTAGSLPGNISVTASNACGISAASVTAVSSDDTPAQPNSILGPTSPCHSSVQYYSILPVPNTTSYLWTLPLDWTGTSTDTSITVTTGFLSGVISVSAVNNCGPGTASILNVNPDSIPAPPSSINGNIWPCTGSSTVYTATSVGNATSYIWTLPSGWTGTSNADTIEVVPSNNPGNLIVKAQNSCGFGNSAFLYVTPAIILSQPGIITGPSTHCEGVAGIYSVTHLAGATSYSWSLPAGWTGSSNTNTIIVTAGASSGNMSVTANNDCGSSTPSTISVNSSPPIGTISSITGDTAPCEGNIKVYRVPPVTNATSYNWTLPVNWLGASNVDSIEVYVTTNGGNVTVQAINICDSTTISVLAVTLGSFLAQPTGITGPTEPCEGDIVKYTADTVATASSYSWTLPSGWTGTSNADTIEVLVGSSSGDIGVSAVNNCGGGNPFYLWVSPSDSINQPGSINGNTSPCVGSNENYVASTVLAATSYIWTLPSGWTGTSITNIISATVGANSGDITVKAVNTCDTSTAQILNIIPEDVPAAAGAIITPNLHCLGHMGIYSVNPITNAGSYVWTLPLGWSGFSSTDSISVFSDTTSGIISVHAVNACGAGDSSFVAVSSDNVPDMPDTIIGNSTPCLGDTTVYRTSSSSGLNSFVWTLPLGWSGFSDVDTIEVIVSSGLGDVTVAVTNQCGTSAHKSLTVFTELPPVTPSVIFGSNFPCVGSVEIYSVISDPNVSGYNWTLPNGWSGTSNSDTIFVVVDTAAGNITVQAYNSCGTSQITSVALTPSNLSGDLDTIYGDPSPCFSSLETYSVDIDPDATGYTWTVPADWTVNNSGSSVNVTVGSQSGTIEVVATNDCGSGAPAVINVYADSLLDAPTIIIGDATPCSGTTKIYSASPVTGAVEYIWGAPLDWVGNSNTDTLEVVVGSLNGTVNVGVVNSCGISSTTHLVVNTSGILNTPGIIIGPSIQCVGDTQVYIVNNDPDVNTYHWTIPSGWTGTSDSNSIIVVAASNSGDITVTAENICGISNPRSKSVTSITILAQPDSIIGASIHCVGDTLTYYVPVSAGATDYTWTLPSGWSGSSDSNSIDVVPLPNASPGNMEVTANNACGSSSPSTLAIGTNTLPQPSAISGPNTTCLGDTAVYSITPPTGNYDIVWTVNGYSVVTTQSTFEVIFTEADTTFIEVAFTDNCGVGTPSTLNVLVDDVPAVPTITRDNNDLVSSSATNKWYYNGNIISGETGQSYTPTENGDYTVEVSNDCGSTVSAAFNVVWISIDELALENVLRVYPNPVSNLLTIDIPNANNATSIELFDLKGEQVYSINNVGAKTQFDVSDLAEGLYLLKVKRDTEFVIRKVVVY